MKGDAINPIQCKLTITHEENKVAGFRIELVTGDDDSNVNYEILDGTGLQSDTTIETIRSAAALKVIKFFPWGFPCIRSLTIQCGYQVIQSSPTKAYTNIEFQDMMNAWTRQRNKRNIDVDNNKPECVNFNRDGHNNSFKAMHVYAKIFKCGEADKNCITDNIKMF